MLLYGERNYQEGALSGTFLLVCIYEMPQQKAMD
jgi:hypothetical protein